MQLPKMQKAVSQAITTLNHFNVNYQIYKSNNPNESNSQQHSNTSEKLLYSRHETSPTQLIYNKKY